MFAYTVYPPSPELQDFVQCYSRFASVEPHGPDAGRSFPDGTTGGLLADDDPLVDMVIACADVFLTFNLGDPLLQSPGGGWMKTRTHVVGPITRPGSMPVAGRVELLGITFRPGWASLFLQAPAEEVTDQTIPLDHFWGTAGRDLEEQLREAITVRQRLRLIEQELLRRLSAAPPLDRTMPRIAALVLRSGGAMTIEHLSTLSGFTRQHLARRFRRELGISPKLYCRLVRFQNTMNRLSIAPPRDWASVAVKLGYYDQAHLIADFKEFSGFTPTTFPAVR
jgi:AraC-like DNA-binding protein